MGVELELQGDRLVAYLSGEIDHHHAAGMREAIDEKAAQVRPQELVLDFHDVTFMDSAGIGLILGRYRWMRQLGGMVRITHVSPQMEQILLLSGIHCLVQIEGQPECINEGASGQNMSRNIFSDSAKEVGYYEK